MDSENNDLACQYTKLQEAVNQSSIHTNRQINSINKNTYIGGFILLSLALAISYFLNIFEYWVPAGFLLFYFIFFTAIRSVRKPFVHKDIKDVLKHHKEKHKDIKKRIESSVQKNIANMVQSLSILYLILFFILLSIEYDWIAVESNVELFIPALTSLLFLPVPFFIKYFYQFNDLPQLKTSLEKRLQKRKDALWKTIFSWKFLNPFIFGFYFALLLFLPMVSIYIMSDLMVEWPYLALIFLFQCFIIILLSNSFSSNTVIKELGSTLTTYSDMNYLLTMANIQNHYSKTEYDRLLTLYESAKPYDFLINDSFMFINYYLIVPNRFSLKEILKHPRKETTEPIFTHSYDHGKPENTQETYKQKQVAANFAKIPSFTPTATNASIQKKAEQTTKRVSLKSDRDIDTIKLGKVGILLYGPMLDNLSKEIKSSIKKRIQGIKTPFNVELARKDENMGGAPSLVPVSSGGAQVKGELIVFKESVTERDAINMLYRMQNHLEGTKKTYKKPSQSSPNVHLIKTLNDFYGVEKVFYPTIGRNINKITPEKLAKLTIDSVFNVNDDEPDGFSYLMTLKKFDISTPMLEACETEILHQTDSSSLWESRRKLERVNEIKANI